MKRTGLAILRNAESIELSALPTLPIHRFRDQVVTAIADGARLAAFFAMRTHRQSVRLFAVLADDQNGVLHALSSNVKESFPSLTAECPQAHLFEREIFEQTGVMPEGHPWLKPVRFAPADWPGANRATTPAIGHADFFKMQGEEIHEVAVGPVHAGVIEPGHFRFQCHGENVYHLEISLGYQHRGIEKALTAGPPANSLHLVQTAAGDTSIGHAMTYAAAVEGLSRMRVPARAQALRGIALELERLANHIGDLGALAGDVGFLPTAAQCGAVRGDFLNMTALLCGSRLGRGMVQVGGVAYDLEPARAAELLSRLRKGEQAVTAAVNLLWNSSSVLSRFETTGVLTSRQATDLGLVGPAARASGVYRDVRHDFPFGIYSLFHIPVSTLNAGDVYSRALVRWLEIQRSIAFIQELVESLPPGEVRNSRTLSMGANRFAVALSEGWRGEICHIVITDRHGKPARYKIVDPSFHNWPGLALCLRGQAISDFPLCNKSFNLSYCGFDL
ncbi:MAG: Formate hydrogenlyase subunit 5 precursor [bacterium ADurb.Bin478]|nr:MAG: Formate hydrogenlyase subunit 5 precursor [bacterium ADurb.Bin478]